MLLRLFFAAFAAGACAGLGISAVQYWITTPLILEAEGLENESGTARGHDKASVPAAKRSGAAHSGGLDRLAYTTLANIILGVGFGMLLAGCFALHGRPVTGSSGVIWGLAGFAVFTLGPAIGLPPELPGMANADLPARQAWWFLAVACTGGGLWFLVFKHGIAWKAGGILLLALPGIIGAPHPDSADSAVPAELASRFATASIVVSAIFWTALGWLAGTFHNRFAKLDPEQ